MHGAFKNRVHPHPESLHRFLLGHATEAEKRAIVLHLLHGCRECLRVTRPVWLLADRPEEELDDLEAPEEAMARRQRRSRRDRRFSGAWRNEG